MEFKGETYTQWTSKHATRHNCSSNRSPIAHQSFPLHKQWPHRIGLVRLRAGAPFGMPAGRHLHAQVDSDRNYESSAWILRHDADRSHSVAFLKRRRRDGHNVADAIVRHDWLFVWGESQLTPPPPKKSRRRKKLEGARVYQRDWVCNLMRVTKVRDSGNSHSGVSQRMFLPQRIPFKIVFLFFSLPSPNLFHRSTMSCTVLINVLSSCETLPSGRGPAELITTPRTI